jgi:DNA-binding transcriptional ArsR family regulator
MVERAEPLDAVFAALSDPTRRAILRRLRKATATVSEIAAPFDVSLNAISKHVMVLERAGLIRRERIGREHHLALRAVPLETASAWLVDYREFWDTRLDRMEQLLRQTKHR